MTYSDSIDWENVIKKEARGYDDADLGEVQVIEGDYVNTKSGVVDKEVYLLPKKLAEKFDGHKLKFNISKEEAEALYRIKE